MFWRFGGYASISAIDSLLDKPDVSLEELLEESELIQELKQLNTKLIEYLRENDVLKKLMDYVVAPSLVKDDDEEEEDADKPTKEDDGSATKNEDGDESEEPKGDPLKGILDPEDLDRAEKERLKRAYVACEILSSEVWSILDSTMANPEHLKEFWGFIRRPAPLDSIQASYFTKVNETLLDKKTGEMLDLLKSMDGIVPAILQHVDNPMVMDLLLKLISLERTEGGQGIVDWLKTQDLIPKLLSFLSSDWPASVQTSAGDFLKAIITISANATQNDQSCIGPNSLTRQLVSLPCVETLIKAMLQGGNPLTVGVGIVIEVIRKNNSDYDPEHLNGPDSMPSTYDPIYLGTLLRVFAKHIPDFVALIQSSKHTVTDGGKMKSVERGELSSAWGAKIEPLGFDRFKTCELMAELLHCSNMGLLNEPGSDEYVMQRDAERERILKEGAFDQHREGTSTFDGNDSTAEFVNGSTLSEGQPKDTKNSEGANAGDESFENVASSTAADKEKEPGDKEDESKSEKAPNEKTPDAAEEKAPTESTDKHASEAKAPSSDPTEELAAQISAVSLETAPASDETQKSAETKSDDPSASVTESVPASAPMASNADAVPAPLFANKEQSQDTAPATSDANDEAKSSEPVNGNTETIPAQVQPALHPDIQVDTNGQPVVGDYLKIMFAENHVVPTILDFFFRFPWNNFLHNVVYDVIQQVFNGPMDRGYNRVLAVDVFETGKITQTIIEGQKRSDETQKAKRIRLGYMGHLTLIAEEVVKFSERHPPELLSPTVMESVLSPEWIDYVEQILSETRERDNAILGGVRPDISIGHRQGMLGTGQSSALADAGLNGMAGNSNFQGFDMVNQGSVSGGAFGGGGNSLLSGFASSSDDDEDEEMDDLDDRHLADSSAESGTENASSQPIPIIAPPPAPLSLGPSRARRQLAARLAAQKQAAENAEGGENDDKQASNEFQWPSGLNEEGQGHSSDFPPGDVSSPTFPESGFSPSDSFSTGSSDEGDDFGGSRRRKERVPLEVDDDDDDMGEMVGPSMDSHMLDSDDEEDAILNESLGYPELGPGQYKSFHTSRMGQSPFGDDQADSSGEEDEGLVEILVPGKKST
ncbi:SIT4 phosphatase-associated protein-domain-containing protein [Aspergillus venezuelensis]